MSSFLYKNEKEEYIREIESEIICKWKVNEICTNDKSEYVADYPYPYCKCESIKDCKYYEREENIKIL